MLWEIEIVPRGEDTERRRIAAEYDLLAHSRQGEHLIQRAVRGYVIEGAVSRQQAERLCRDLLVDPLVETAHLRRLDIPDGNGKLAAANRPPAEERAPNPIRSHFETPQAAATEHDDSRVATVLLKPGVMDPVAQSVQDAAGDMKLSLDAVQTFRRYLLDPACFPLAERQPALARTLANDAIERIGEGSLLPSHLALGRTYKFQRIVVPLRDLDDVALVQLSREGQLSLNLPEMQAIQAHFRSLGREPTDVELETLAQTWSEHCSHKTLKGKIDYSFSREAPPNADSVRRIHGDTETGRHGDEGRRTIDNLLKETIFGATEEIRRRLGADDWCVSVFEDNAGVVKFDDRYHVCFKVETHNHPSAIEPYGGANTGLGGVIRDPLGTALGAKPICNTDVFCFAPPDTDPATLPPGVLHPRKVMQGVVAGVRDYGNRIGIPTVNGAVCFDERYLANPLVFCGTVGLIPVERARKEAKPGDRIVVVGGRTGRDGIHGATFSSIQLTAESDRVSGGAVQIGNAITEKKMLDVLLQARDQGLYHAITDCGAGGFSSAVGEMGEKIGAAVHLDKAPLKYQGLSYTEIWISEAQERMILAVPPESWPKLQALCTSENVEATAIGTFEATGRLKLFYEAEQVTDLDMHFLHDGRPRVVRQAVWRTPSPPTPLPRSRGEGSSTLLPLTTHHSPLTTHLLRLLSSLDVCSKEWIIRQYDHEVQGGSVVKPLVGIQDDGPGDAAVVMPVLGSHLGLAIGCGICPRYGDIDPYWMAAAAIDEAVRNVVAVGADPARIALLDNFCWGNTDRPETLGTLVRAAEACRDVALAFNMPFISGKDSLNNEYHSGERNIVIPPTLLISALGRVPDVRRCMTMDFKEPGNELYLVGITRAELGGSQFASIDGVQGGMVPRVDLGQAPIVFRRLHEAIHRGLVRSCHDVSDGGLAVALAEMAFAGGVGADITDCGSRFGLHDDVTLLFSESTTRFVLEVTPANALALQEYLQGITLSRLGKTCKEQRLRIAGLNGEWIVWAELKDMKEAWQRTLRW